MAKKKKPTTTATTTSTISISSSSSVLETILQVSEGSIESTSITTDSATVSAPDTTEKNKSLSFKNPTWIAKNAFIGKRSKVWKSLKQILASERQLHGHGVTLYSNIEASPSTRCLKKYSDISGLPAKYTDPLTKLRYSNTMEFRKLRSLAPEIVQGYLSLRKAEVVGQL